MLKNHFDFFYLHSFEALSKVIKISPKISTEETFKTFKHSNKVSSGIRSTIFLKLTSDNYFNVSSEMSPKDSFEKFTKDSSKYFLGIFF